MRHDCILPQQTTAVSLWCCAPSAAEKLSNLQAIRACPRDTRWLIVTNGDNEYASDLFAQIAPHSDAELVALDYYSRYQRSTALPCERFKQEADAPACKQNL